MAAHGITIEMQEMMHRIELQNLPHRPFNFSGVPEHDKAVVAAILQALYLVNPEAQSKDTRSATHLDTSEDRYTITVRYDRMSELRADELLAIWDASPLHVEAVIVAPARIHETGISYVAVTAIVRSTQAAPSVRFVVMQQQKHILRLSRTAMYNAQARSAHQSLLIPDGPAQYDSEDVPSGKVAKRTVREPWAKLTHRADQTAVRQIVETCFQMAINPNNERFWDLLEVDDAVPGVSDRIFVRWTLPEGEAIDVLAFSTLNMKFPLLVDWMYCSLHHNRTRALASSLPRVTVTIVVYATSADTVTSTQCRIRNIYSTHATQSTSAMSSINGPSMTLRSEDNGASNDPVRIATSKMTMDEPSAKRVRGEAFGDDSYPSPRPLTEPQESPGAFQPAKRQRIREERDQYHRQKTSGGLLSTLANTVKKFY